MTVKEANEKILSKYPYSDNDEIDYHAACISCLTSGNGLDFVGGETLTAHKLNEHCIALKGSA